MRDYRQRLFQGIEDTQSVIAHVMQYIQSKAKPVYQPYSGQDTYNDRYHQQGQMPFTTYLQLSEKRTSLDALPVRIPLNLNAHFWNADSSDYPAKARRPAKVVVFNSHAFVVQEAIRIHVTDSVQKVLGPEGHELEFQLNPVWGYSAELPTGLYELLFIAKLAPLSTTTFEVNGTSLTIMLTSVLLLLWQRKSIKFFFTSVIQKTLNNKKKTLIGKLPFINKLQKKRF